MASPIVSARNQGITPSSRGLSAAELSPIRQGQNVFARLQGLFPPTPSTSSAAPTSEKTQEESTSSRKPGSLPPKVLKVRILTWNMHDSVPKGDLVELLGTVPPYQPTQEGSFPNLTLDVNHPYHLVVVAGQECPSLSGIPMGLGAGFKLIDKDKDRDKDKDKEKARGDRDYDKPRHKHKEKEKDEPAKLRKPGEDGPHEAPSGWTSIIEDWLCHGSGSGLAPSPEPGDILKGSPKPASELSRNSSSKEKPKGPYQLLIKERMMGIYLAVYINRDIRSLVQGTSRSAVTAGLIGGRVGNKGGVGISIKLAGTTLLFLNAHLAAHEGKVNHRLANLAKIKAELSVDDYLSADDPRLMAEDLTDRFDYSFLCGDLNFRLDISRLHADWLISRQEYSQALAFDQLRRLMQTGQAFVGFNEGPIDFPPTFKYDVLRTLKKAKRKSARINHWKHPDKPPSLNEAEEKELEDLDDDDGEDEDVEEAASVSSSVWTSMHSRAGTDVDDDEYFHASTSQGLSAHGSKAVISHAAHKAKEKWIALISPSVPTSPAGKWFRSRHSIIGQSPRDPPVSFDVIPDTPPMFVSDHPKSDLGQNALLRPPVVSRSGSTKSFLNSEAEGDKDDDDDKGVYDSSHKKRVPSWCDRILWKSTVEPDPEPEEEDQLGGSLARPKTRMGQFFAAFKPSSARARRESYSSATSATTSTDSDDTTDIESPLASPGVLATAAPFSRFASPQHRRGNLFHSRSNESLPVTEKPPLPPRTTTATDVELGLRRSISATPPATTTPLHHPRRGSIGQSDNRPPEVPPKDNPHHLPTPYRWRFFPFLTRDSPQPAPPSRSSTPEPPPPRKGDVVCLSYNTLDDRGMRRLEGRSDHRPVIGSYAIYL